MGAHASKDAHGSSRSPTERSQRVVVDSIDYGSVLPNGLYPTSQQEYNLRNVRNLIMARRLAPFYKGLADAPEDNVDDSKADTSAKKIQQAIYSDTIECPICFLYYPSNMNYSRCCDQPICTECFLQIKRHVETPSVPAACPFCLEENFGVVYEPPTWSEKAESRGRESHNRAKVSPTLANSDGTQHTTSGISKASKPRRKSVSHKSPGVVLVDHVRPDWNKPQNVTRPTPRRNSESVNNNNRGRGLLRTAVSGQLFGRPGRSASSAAAPEYNPHRHAAYMRDMNLDLEEYLVMEAIRMSLAEYEEAQQRTEQQNRSTEDNTDHDTGVSASSPCATEAMPADNSSNPPLPSASSESAISSDQSSSSENELENAAPKTCQHHNLATDPSANTLN